MPDRTAPWPSRSALLMAGRTDAPALRRRLQLGWALMTAARRRRMVASLVRRCPWLHDVLERHPVLFLPLLGPFLDARFGRRLASQYFAHDLEFGSGWIRRAQPWFFPTALDAGLWSDRGSAVAVRLAVNLAHPWHGLWELCLRGGNGARILAIGFSVLPGPRLFIGSVQGTGAGSPIDACALVRMVTRDLAGLSPQCILVEALRELARSWGIAEIIGVSSAHRVDPRFGCEGRPEAQLAYDDFFAGLGAAGHPDGNWCIPVAARGGTDRRAAAMLAGIRSDVRTRLGGYDGHFASSSSRNLAPATGLNTYAGISRNPIEA